MRKIDQIKAHSRVSGVSYALIGALIAVVVLISASNVGLSLQALFFNVTAEMGVAVAATTREYFLVVVLFMVGFNVKATAWLLWFSMCWLSIKKHHGKTSATLARIL